MNSRVSWSVDGIDPSVRERAEAAARRAGMSLNDWLNSTVGDFEPAGFPPSPSTSLRTTSARPASPQHRAVDDIHHRLDSITRQIEQISQPRNEPVNAPRGEPAVARQLNDAISRLDARLSQITNPVHARQGQQDAQRQTDMVERAAAHVYSPSPPISPASFDLAIAEIVARQSELDAPRQMPPREAPPMAPSFAPQPMMPQPAQMAPPPAPDFSALERHLFKITNQIEALQRPDHLEQSIAAFRSELAEIRHAITEAMPRQAIESIENEIRSLSRRIDENRSSGTDSQALASIERALGEIYDALRSLTPAEHLAGYDDAIRNLARQARPDPAQRMTIPRPCISSRARSQPFASIVSNVASNDALARLSDDVHMLSSKVDQLGHSPNGSLAMLEQRIAALTSTIESREQRPAAERGNSEYLESAIRTLSERIDRMPVGNDNASAFAHLEQRVSYLLERIEASTDPPRQQPRPRRGRAAGYPAPSRSAARQPVAIADNSRQSYTPPPMDSGIVDIVKRELSDIRFSQSETDRRTQDALETVHSTLGHVVDRLAMIEGDLRTARAPHLLRRPRWQRRCRRAEPPPAPPRLSSPSRKPQRMSKRRGCAAAEAGIAESRRHTRTFRRRSARLPRRRTAVEPPPADPPAPPRAISEILGAARHAARRDRAGTAAGSSARARHPAGPADVLAVGADRCFRGTRSAKSRRVQKSR